MAHVDVVYTWVDGSDPAWQTLLAATLRSNATHRLARDAVTPNRSIDRQELRFSLRSLEAFLPWVRRVIIVTPNQRPPWLVPCERITVIDQNVLFSRLDDTPTFNSHAIESNLDRIPGLSERFLYLNDDMMFGQLHEPADFFDPQGRPRVSFALRPRLYRPLLGRFLHAPCGAPRRSDNGFQLAWKNNCRLLQEAFGPARRLLPAHQVQPLTRSLFARARELFSDSWRRVSSSRFRSPDDIHPVGLATHVGLCTRAAVATGVDRGKLFRYGDRVLRNELALRLIPRRHHTLCLNDDTTLPPRSLRNRMISSQIRRFLEKRYPTRASWEVDDDSRVQP